MKSEQPDFLIMTDPYAEARAAKAMDFSAGSKKTDKNSARGESAVMKEAQPLSVVDVQAFLEKLVN